MTTAPHSRLDGGHPTAPSGCVECGSALRSRGAEFCSPACRRSFNNRRLVRGAELYDLVMAWRFDRKAAAAAKALGLICRIAHIHREADKRERDGRRSWMPPQAIIARRPSLLAQVLVVRRRNTA